MEPASWLGFVTSLLWGAVGGVGAVSGLSRWLGDIWLGRLLEKEKAKYSRELEQLKANFAQELERRRAEIEKSVFVTRAHFETEFAAYKQVFEALAQIRLAIEATRPMMSVSPARETHDDKLRKLTDRLNELIDAHNKAVNVTENLRPFYPAPLYHHLLQCLKAASLEIMDIQTAGDETFGLKWFEEGAQQRDQFMTAYSEVADMIRGRIETLAVLPRG